MEGYQLWQQSRSSTQLKPKDKTCKFLSIAMRHNIKIVFNKRKLKSLKVNIHFYASRDTNISKKRCRKIQLYWSEFCYASCCHFSTSARVCVGVCTCTCLIFIEQLLCASLISYLHIKCTEWTTRPVQRELIISLTPYNNSESGHLLKISSYRWGHRPTEVFLVRVK